MYEAINRVAFPGSIADGGAAHDTLPSLPGLTIGGRPVSLPLTDDAAKTLLQRSSVAWPVRDGAYRNTYQITADKIAFANPSWEEGLDDLLDTVCIRLGMERSRVTAVLDMMFVMEPGARIEKRRDESAAADEVLGTLLVQLPSSYTGGSIRVRHEYEYVEEDDDEKYHEDSDGDEDLVDQATLLRAVDLLYIAAEDESPPTARDVIRSLERDHKFQMNAARKESVQDRLSGLIDGDVLPQIEERSDTGTQPSRGMLLRAVNLLYFATDGSGSFGIDEVCRSIEDAHQIVLDQSSREIITNHVAGIIEGTVLPTLDDDFSDAMSVETKSDELASEPEEEEPKDIREVQKRFQLGAEDDSAFGCRFMCYYGGCEFSMKTIQTGRRVVLAYSLCYDAPEAKKTKKKSNEKNIKPNATLVCSSVAPLERSLALLPRADRIFLRPLGFVYEEVSLANCGIDALEESDRRIAQGLKVAAGKDWKFFIVEAKMVHNRVTGYYGNTTKSEYSSGDLVKAFDEDGEEMDDETKDWISSVLDLTSSEVNDNGMILCRETGDAFNPGPGCDCGTCGPKFVPSNYTVVDVWGKGDCKSSDYGSYGDDTKIDTTYNCNFLLAYDTSAEFELMALGGQDAISDAVDDVLDSGDVSLLNRFVQMIQLKGAKCALPLSSCQSLLSMLLDNDEKPEEDRLAISEKDLLSFVPLILRNLSSSDEPDQKLYDLILTAIQKLGWYNLITPISAVMNSKSKLQDMTLSQFLRRVEFIFRAEASSSCSAKEVTTFLDLSCYDFSSSKHCKTPTFIANKSDRIDTPDTYDTLEGLVKTHGWATMEKVVQVTISGCAAIDEKQNNLYREESTGLMKRAETLLRLYSANPSGRSAMQKLLCGVASDIVEKIEKPDKMRRSQGAGSALKDFDILESKEWMHLLLKRVLFCHGSQAIFDRFGKCLVVDKGALLKVFKHLDEDKTQLHPIQRDIMNKCLVQHSIDGGWKEKASEDFRSSSLHIRSLLSSYPRIACERDLSGRLPLHWSIGCKTPKLDNVTDIFNSNTKAVSVLDPVTGLYPFMLAAKQGCADAAFMLLREDPSLLSSGIAKMETKKRKRSNDSSS